ncbi:hypothetical protein [Methanomassiliicoccus luminyensis]|jgi:hypothetical protein|uniref:hypothetical protein n=1 Tax=Methanomassiliicoccus luminyensis TaxID=1080712 RepID=UPI00035D26F8|nr:hypothetical protein [Methanomassiliicoccus luminyensis]
MSEQMFKVPLCFSCKRFHWDKDMRCEAYPDGIPNEIIWSKVYHTEPYKGDHGLTFLDEDAPSDRQDSTLSEEVPSAGN